MDDPAADWTLFCISADLGHQVVMYLGLDGQTPPDINILLMLFEISDLLCRDEACLLLSFSQRYPQPPPEQTFAPLRPQLAHSVAAIPPGERGEKRSMGEVVFLCC